MTPAFFCTIISCLNGTPSVLPRENATKLHYLHLASRRDELVQSVLPLCCTWFCYKEHWSQPQFCEKPAFPFSVRVLCLWGAVDLKPQESPSLLFGCAICFRHILNPVVSLCFFFFWSVTKVTQLCCFDIMNTALFAHITEAYNKIQRIKLCLCVARTQIPWLNSMT